jgi:predicted transcriptional regulator
VSKAVRELARTGLVGTAKAGRAGGGVRSLTPISTQLVRRKVQAKS